MSVSAEVYIVISLMFAVFAAVAAVGTSLVLGVGFERLRAGFEIVRKQSGFFADAIHKLDERTNALDEKMVQTNRNMAHMADKIIRVEKTGEFLGGAIESIEARILGGSAQAKPAIDTLDRVLTRPENTPPKIRGAVVHHAPPQPCKEPLAEPPRVMAANANASPAQPITGAEAAETHKASLSHLLMSYLSDQGESVRYH